MISFKKVMNELKSKIKSFERNHGKNTTFRRRYNRLLTGGESIYLTPHDLRKSPSDTLSFRKIKISPVDHNKKMAIVNNTRAKPWLKRAFYYFKFNRTLALPVLSGTYKRVIIDPDKPNAYSFEYYDSPETFRAESKTRIKMRETLQDIDVVVPKNIMIFPQREGGFIIQNMEKCNSKDLYYAMSDAFEDKTVESILNSVIGQIIPELDIIHARKVYHQDIKSENIFLCPNKDGGKRWKLGDFDGGILEKEGQTMIKLKQYSATTVFFKGYTITPEEARLNDIAAICVLILYICSRFFFMSVHYYSQENPKLERKAKAIFDNIFAAKNTSPIPNLPETWNLKYWNDVTEKIHSWDETKYEACFRDLKCNSYLNTVRFCLQTLSNVPKKGNMDMFAKNITENYNKDKSTSQSS